MGGLLSLCRPDSDSGLATRLNEAQKLLLHCGAFLQLHDCFMAAVCGRLSSLPVRFHSRFANPSTAATPFVWRRLSGSPYQLNEGTAHDPIHAHHWRRLHPRNPAHRHRSASGRPFRNRRLPHPHGDPGLETIAFRSDISSDTVVLTDFCKLLTTSLRDGCDVMDVIGRRLRAQAAE